MESNSIQALCNALLDASGGTNADQLRGALDILCGEAAEVLSSGGANDFCELVLALLSDQENFSEMVRSAYLDLFSAWLGVGPSAREYAEVLAQAVAVWRRIASPLAVGWAASILEAATDSPCPDPETRTRIAVELVEDARRYFGRLGLRDRVEVESLAVEFGLPSRPVEAQEGERDLWSTLNGKMIGIYSLLPRVAVHLQYRLAQLCTVGELVANQDTVATPALRRLAGRADYLIVDTWHAAHQATEAIDEVRPRARQILPRQRGLTGFLRALEEVLA